jgi:transposase
MPVRVVRAGTVADFTQAGQLICGIKAGPLIADTGYDFNATEEQAKECGMEVVIRPKSNRKNPRNDDQHRVKLRHLVEYAFLSLKDWRGIATRYAKRLSHYLAAIQFRCAILWLSIS